MHARSCLAAALAVSLAACGGGGASPPALAYRLPTPAEASYDVHDTATVSMQALGQSLDLRVESSAVYALGFARADDGVMVTLSGFRRRLISGDQHRDVELPAGMSGWLPAQQHAGENIGDTPTEVIFVELKDGGPWRSGAQALGPD